MVAPQTTLPPAVAAGLNALVEIRRRRLYLAAYPTWPAFLAAEVSPQLIYLLDALQEALPSPFGEILYGVDGGAA